MLRHLRTFLFLLAGLWATPFFLGEDRLRADEPIAVDSARLTPTVRLIARCLPSVVSLRAYAPTENPLEEKINHGSGSIIHSDGYILTNFHVVQSTTRGVAELSSGEQHAYRLVAGFANEDLALLKIDVGRSLPALALGRSHDLLLGEPVIAIGNPAGLVSTASEGIISGLRRATSTEYAFLPAMIQTSAATSGGSSGGPLINALGSQIGVVTSRKTDAENIGFAIAIDRVREVLPRMLAAEDRAAVRAGLAFDPLAAEACVTEVVPDLPAAAAGLAVGDVIVKIDQAEIRQALDWQIALLDRRPGQKLSLETRRGAEQRQCELTLSELKSPTVAEAGAQPGLRFAAWEGHWSQLPNFAEQPASLSGVAEKPASGVFTATAHDFALEFVGLLKLPADGLYTFYTRSDDGSRLYIDGRLVVDNDGQHPEREAAGLARLTAGNHEFRAQYFESDGDQSLTVSYEGPGVAKQEIPPSAYSHRSDQ